MDKRIKIIRIASIIGISGNLILAILKICGGVIGSSMAVLGDGLDSSSDVIISCITLVTSVIVAMPPDREHPYGHHRAETVATSLLAFIIFFMGGQLFLTTARMMISGESYNIPDRLTIYVTIISICGKLVLAWSQYQLGRKSGSDLLKANGVNMRNDVLMSAGVLAGLGLVYLFSLPVLDRLIAMGIGMFIMISAIRIYTGVVTELMEGVGDRAIYGRIFRILNTIDGAGNPHRVRARRLGAMYVIDLDIEVAGDLTVYHAHRIAERVERELRRGIDNIYDVVVHVEPKGIVDRDECYGINGKDIKEQSVE